MDPCPDRLGSSIPPLQESLVRGEPATGPDTGNALGPHETEDVLSLDWILQRDDLHAVFITVIPGGLPGELPPPVLPPGEEISPTLKVVVAPPGGGDGLNTELVKLDGLASTLAGGDGEGDGVS